LTTSSLSLSLSFSALFPFGWWDAKKDARTRDERTRRRAREIGDEYSEEEY
jgi:hypothetical protein